MKYSIKGISITLITARNCLLAMAAIVTLSVVYYFVFALPADNRAILQLEREKVIDEKIEKQIGALRKESEKQTEARIAKINEESLQYCLDAAERDYWDYVKLNGTEVPGKKGVYTAPQHVFETARKDRKEAIDECYRQFSH